MICGKKYSSYKEIRQILLTRSGVSDGYLDGGSVLREASLPKWLDLGMRLLDTRKAIHYGLERPAISARESFGQGLLIDAPYKPRLASENKSDRICPKRYRA